MLISYSHILVILIAHSLNGQKLKMTVVQLKSSKILVNF